MTTVDLPVPFQEILLAHLPYAKDGSVTPQDELPALGLDSMGMLQLLTALEDHYDLDFPDELLNEDTFATVGSLWSTVSKLLAPASHGDG
ncbi:phosphopantetheine-binding protein [Streptomyces sp. NPDC056452]|uniref:phosphopantetheine-binding protein n=1 Tax=Streptomyces sp. NPDC056452 TaxID=3345821 RepID=UPI00368DA711